MNKIVVNKKSIDRFLVCLVLTVFFSIYMLLQRGKNSDSSVRLCVLFSLCVFAFELYCIVKNSGVLFNPMVIFLLSFYLFQNGQLLLLALGVDFNDFYIQTLRQHTLNVAVFSSISNMLAGLAGVLVTAQKVKKRNCFINSYKDHIIAKYVFIGFLLTGMVAVPLVVYKFTYALRGGYAAVRSLENTIPSLINIVEYMFVPFSFLVLFYEKTKLKQQVVRCIVIFWFIITALCGDRTTGIVGLFITVFIQYSTEKNNVKRKKRAVTLIVASMLLMVFIEVAYAFRTGGDIIGAVAGSRNLVTKLISEFGFSCFPLFTMMNIVPSCEPFLYGKGYLFSMIGGIIPSSLDITGTISKINHESRIFEQWQTQYYGQYSFGFGFSLNSEAYINFGWFGLIAIFLVCLFVLGYLRRFDFKQNNNKFEMYAVCILLFSWLTLPRRDSYYIWKALAYCIWLIKLYLMIFCKKKRYLK